MKNEVLQIEKDRNRRNRFYITDETGNKLFYGTTKECKLFTDFIECELANEIYNKMVKEGVIK